MNLQDRIQDMVNEIQYQLGNTTKEICQEALVIQLQDMGIFYEKDKIMPIMFHNRFVGDLKADFVVDHRIVIMMCGEHDTLLDQCRMYKRISQLPFGMILFSKRGPLIELC
jgi:GxxExxY protein